MENAKGRDHGIHSRLGKAAEEFPVLSRLSSVREAERASGFPLPRVLRLRGRAGRAFVRAAFAGQAFETTNPSPWRLPFGPRITDRAA